MIIFIISKGVQMSTWNIQNPDALTALASVVVGATSTKVLDKKDSRKSFTIINISNENIFYGVNETAVLNKGLCSYPGGVFQIDLSNGNPIFEVYAICASGSKTVTITEGF
jgi:hypothetical protein